MRVVLFCGSAGPRSSNRALLDVIEHLGVQSAWDVTWANGVGQIPMFDPAVGDDAAPVPVAALRHAFESADAAILAIPEYGGGVAGWAKNALDWMVGSGSLYGRVAAVLCAGTTGGPNALGQVARTLTWQGAHVVATAGVAAPSTKRDATGRFVDEATLEALAELVTRLADAGADAQRRDALRSETLDQLEIPRDDRSGAGRRGAPPSGTRQR